jgi:hypothetical protein
MQTSNCKNVNPISENVLACNLNNINYFFHEHCENSVKNEHHMLFFLQNIVIACKTKFPILFA